MRFQSKYDDPTRNLRGIKLTYEESNAAYTCRHCGQSLGCAMCLEDIADIVCKECRDWGNDIAETVHGRMVRNEELKSHGMKLVQMATDGKIDMEQFDKLWGEARALLREPQSAMGVFRGK